jgi:GNAT superfamily N-acetyltransferase
MNVELSGPREDEIKELSEFLMGQFREGAYAPLNPTKAIRTIYQAAVDGMSFIVRDADAGDKIVGALALHEHDYWYSDWHFLTNPYFYVDPTRRFARIGVLLMRAARQFAEEKVQIDGSRGMTTFVVVNNPDRRTKGTQNSLFASIAGYTPLGHVIKIR